MIRKIIIGAGAALSLYGIWFWTRVHSAVGVCSAPLASNTGAVATGRTCASIVASYGEGFIFVIAGVLVMFIAFTMIQRDQRLSLKSELRAVPRQWAQRHYSATSDEAGPWNGVDRRVAQVSPPRNALASLLGRR
ncbi:MAG: hypothetical protein ACRDV0_03080 [Acidimicrobiales bacterium]